MSSLCAGVMRSSPSWIGAAGSSSRERWHERMLLRHVRRYRLRRLACAGCRGIGLAGDIDSDHGSYERTTDETSFRYERGQRERELEALPHHNLQEPIEAQWV